MQVAIGLGSNIGDRKPTIERALAEIKKTLAAPDGATLRVSTIIETDALPIPERPEFEQPAFLNAVAVVETELPLTLVLEKLLEIEQALGRERSADSVRWGPRVIDLDIICAGDIVSSTEKLVLPHPEMQHRLFVLQPLCELLPDWRHPLLNKTATELLAELQSPS